MMESVDRLRDYCDKLRNVDDNHVSAEYVAERCAIDVRRMADGIEREIAERYVELPVDADGVPIHVGDVVSINGLSGTLPVGGIGCGRVWFMYDGSAEFATVMNVHHAKPRTVEDVLRDFQHDTPTKRTCKLRVLPGGYYATTAVQCLECHAVIATTDREWECCKISYCPNCGAKVVD